MKSKLILTAAVLSAMAGGVISYAEGEIKTYDTTNESASIADNGKKPFKVAGTKIEIKFAGSGADNWTIDWSEAARGEWKAAQENLENPEKQPDMVAVSKNNQLTIQNLDSLNFTTTYNKNNSLEKVNTGIKAFSGAEVNLSNINTINFGTEDQKFYGDQALHAYGGTITLKDVGNLYVNAAGGAVLMSQYAEGHDGKLDIEANSVNIKSDSVGVCVGAYQKPSSGKPGEAELIVEAKDQVNISTGDAALSVSGSYQGGEDAPTVANVQISGKNGVILDGLVGIVDTRNNANGTTTVNISSADGNVMVRGDKGAIFTNGISGTHNFDIEGTTVTLTSEGGNLEGGHSAAVELNGTNTALNIHADKTFISVGNASDTGNALYLTNGSKTEFAGKEDGSHGDVYIDGYVTVKDGAKATFADNTTTHVDGKYLANTEKSFITADNDSSVSFKDNTKFVIDHAQTGELNFSKNDSINQAFENMINGGRVSTDNLLQNVTLNTETGEMTVGIVTKDKAAELLGGSALTNVALAATEKNMDSVTALITNNASDTDAVKAALKSAAGLSGLANVAHSTYTMNGLFSDAVSGHLMNRQDQDVWAYGFHSKENVNGLSFGGDYDAQYNGVTAGVDLYKNGGTTAGVALTYGDSNVSGSNGFATTKSDADYYGASIYGRFDRGSYALLGDISYMKGDHDVTQYNSNTIITASPDSDSISVGVKALKDYAAGDNGVLTPYVGLRYLRLSTDDFTASNGLHYVGDDQDLVIVPVGVNYTASISHGKWSVRPYAGIGYVWTAGDRSADQTVVVPEGADSFSYDTADSSSFIARVGVTTDCDDMSYGIGYSWQKGDSVSNNAWTVSASYHF